MRSLRIASLASAILLAAGNVAAMVANPVLPIAAPAGTRAERRQRNAAVSARPTRRRPGPGRTNKHVQRMAKKARGVARNRRAHRG